MHRPCSFCNEMAGVTCLRLLPCALPVWASVTDGGGMCGYAITACKGNSRKLVTPQKDAVAVINVSPDLMSEPCRTHCQKDDSRTRGEVVRSSWCFTSLPSRVQCSHCCSSVYSYLQAIQAYCASNSAPVHTTNKSKEERYLQDSRILKVLQERRSCELDGPDKLGLL